MYFININITQHVLRVNLKMKKPIFCCCFAWIVFIELNFTVACQLTRKTWDDRFVSKKNQLYGPLLWMGFNCPKTRATSRKQFTCYQ